MPLSKGINHWQYPPGSTYTDKLGDWKGPRPGNIEFREANRAATSNVSWTVDTKCQCEQAKHFGARWEYSTNGDGGVFAICAWCGYDGVDDARLRVGRWWGDRAVGHREWSDKPGQRSAWSTYK